MFFGMENLCIRTFERPKIWLMAEVRQCSTDPIGNFHLKTEINVNILKVRNNLVRA